MNTELIIKYRKQTGDIAKKTGDDIIIRNLSLVRAVASKYRLTSANLTIGDLINEGVMGLIEARDRFDPEMGYEFSTYATYWVRRNILRALSEHSRTIRVPERIAIVLPKLRRAIDDYVRLFGCEPDLEEIATPLGLSKAVATAAYAALHAPASIDGKEFVETESGAEAVDETVMTRLRNQQIRKEIRDTLTPDEATVILGRFGLGDDEKEHTLADLGNQLNISREWVRQIEATALSKLKKTLRKV